ncbi:hypothetical protein BGI41_06045 [Methanobrevibacter sp. 87.7]|uniref:hypothetical protein n=1 Tax=Methanobrevibacter sp. 87.7 TaxID=387957 RepID=UPI000B50288F|nr:hypothetical protein [Methanobrevibacter sp. 87.7]OWT32745.1 hypothetical protein BGI41_06045 [Methanobrevibacter sp. 87.7]
MMKNNKKILFFTLCLIILICCISNISATNTNNTNLTNIQDNIELSENFQINNISENSINTINQNSNKLINENKTNVKKSDYSSDSLKYESNTTNTLDNNTKVIDNNNFYIINKTSFYNYFDENNILKPEYSDRILVFEGEFKDIGTISINSDNVTITGNNTLFYNTVFNLNGSGIFLENLNLCLNSTYPNNQNAGIFVGKDNNTLYNITLNYTIPDESTGIGILVKGPENYLNEFYLINSTINVWGNSKRFGNNYGVIVKNTNDALIYGNKINAKLPLRSVSWDSGIFGGISMDSVLAFGADSCNSINFINNYIFANSTGGIQEYPTLDACMFYRCDNAVIKNNTIIEEDFVTPKGTDNYLYGLDVYIMNDVTIIDNNIHIRTDGGKEAAGTAYPIQINGPSANIKIAYNNLTSINNGPNIGIYSNNYYGDTKIDIISNFINITGFASTQSWALVSGVELQDSNDTVLNNTIYVNTNGDKDKGNIYGISYTQGTSGDHTYKIKYNQVVTNGYYGISLGVGQDVVNSEITYNKIQTKYLEGNKAIIIIGYNNIKRYNTGLDSDNNEMPEDELPSWVKQYQNKDYSHNVKKVILKIGDNTAEGSNGTGININKDNSSSTINNKGNSRSTINNNGNSRNNNISINGPNGAIFGGNIITNGLNRIRTNSTGSNVGSSNDFLATISAASPGENGGSAADEKAYELNKNNPNNNVNSYTIPIAIIIIIVAILLILGYKHRKNNDDGEI